MGSISDYLENELIDHVVGNATYTPAATIYLCLCTADPTDAGTGASMNEVANSGSYARTAVAFDAAASRAIDSTAQVSFPQATGNWGTVTHWAITDSNTYGAGNMLAYGALTASKSVVTGNIPRVAADDVQVSVDPGEVSTYLANALLDFAFRNQAFSSPATYMGLADATLSDTTTGATVSEPSGGSYARVLVNPNGGGSPTWNNAVANLVDNADQIDMPTPTGSWGTIVASFVVDAATNGNILFYDNGVTDQAVGVSDPVYFPAGDVDLTFT